MQAAYDQKKINPLEGLVSKEVYQALARHDLLNEKGVRDFQIRRKFKHLRDDDVPAYDAIELIREDYPYLQFDTVRKIVYKVSK